MIPDAGLHADRAVRMWSSQDDIHRGKLAPGVKSEDWMLSVNDFARWLAENKTTEPVVPPQGIVLNLNFIEGLDYLGEATFLSASYLCVDELPEVLFFLLDPQGRPVLVHVLAKQHVLCIAAAAMNLPSDFEDEARALAVNLENFFLGYAKATTIEVVQRRTAYSRVAEQLGRRTYAPQERVKFKLIKSVKRIYVGPVAHRPNWSEPGYKVQVDGFWRKVPGVGKDADGKPILGKTWVKAHTRWNAKPSIEQKVVWVKEPLKEGD